MAKAMESTAHSSYFLLSYLSNGLEYVAVVLLTLSRHAFYQDPWNRFLAPLPLSKVRTNMQTYFHSIVVECLICTQHMALLSCQEKCDLLEAALCILLCCPGLPILELHHLGLYSIIAVIRCEIIM